MKKENENILREAIRRIGQTPFAKALGFTSARYIREVVAGRKPFPLDYYKTLGEQAIEEQKKHEEELKFWKKVEKLCK